LGERFSTVEISAFDGIRKDKYGARLLSILLNLVCDNEAIIVNHPAILSLRWRLYVRHFLYDIPEARCRRLLAECRK
jgi:hypothetical protein